MTGAYAMGAPWARFAGRCSPEWSALSDWLAKMTGHPTGHHGSRGQHPFGQWGMFGDPPSGAPFGPWWGAGRSWRGPKARRGDIRAAILGVLAEQP